MSYPSIKTGQLIVVNGRLYRYLHQNFTQYGEYCDRVICLKENPLNQLIGLIYCFFEQIREPLGRYEAVQFDIKEGEMFPKGSVSYIIGKIYQYSNLLGERIDQRFINVR